MLVARHIAEQEPVSLVSVHYVGQRPVGRDEEEDLNDEDEWDDISQWNSMTMTKALKNTQERTMMPT
ncbi:hypothetical protein FVEN_g12760 [Fusarium venenatum]|uniref:Uncharacterized protein n=1 Tax=Fusarium venenatum TaxID=56646 RepID=A0A2L2TG19_9HYPO|nr:uncharacterized protein FVRRES_09115 [Fusarium venenatum]KAG8358372.1 hypothetical protein FVEN_g12760 [Fusarium venenatum]CEI69038.1 unnamed protein product [Fusarium venenatum]